MIENVLIKDVPQVEYIKSEKCLLLYVTDISICCLAYSSAKEILMSPILLSLDFLYSIKESFLYFSDFIAINMFIIYSDNINKRTTLV